MGIRTHLALWSLSLVACTSDPAGHSGGVLGPLEPAQLATADDMKLWSGTSAPAAYFSALTPLFLGGFTVNGNPPACPVQTVSGTTTTYSGGCTDDQMRVWFGTATEVGSTTTSATITYQGFGYDGMTTCMNAMYPDHLAFDGTIHQTVSGTTNSFTIDVSTDSSGVNSMTCMPASGQSAISYAGTMVATGPDSNGDGKPDGQLWNGSGELGNTLYGKVSAKTSDELLDNHMCSHEALSGTTTVTTGGHVAVITYDGASSCDQDSSVTWTLDGVDQGTLTGVSCSTGGARGSWPLALALALVLRSRRWRTPAAKRSTSARSRSFRAV